MDLPEIVTVGIYNSQIAAKNTAVSKNRKITMFEIELPLEDGGVSYIDDNTRRIHPNMLICAKPGQIRHTRFPFKCYYVHVIVRDGALHDMLMKVPDFVETDNVDIYKDIFTKLVKHSSTLADSEELLLQSLLLELLYYVTKESAKRSRRHYAGNHGTIENALQYIKDHLTEGLSLQTVADAMSISPVHFHNTFKRAVGKTLREYIEEQRIKKAIQLLLTTNDSLTEVAFACGFSSQSYFNYVFKRKMNKTPREYVKDSYKEYEL